MMKGRTGRSEYCGRVTVDCLTEAVKELNQLPHPAPIINRRLTLLGTLLVDCDCALFEVVREQRTHVAHIHEVWQLEVHVGEVAVLDGRVRVVDPRVFAEVVPIENAIRRRTR